MLFKISLLFFVAKLIAHSACTLVFLCFKVIWKNSECLTNLMYSQVSLFSFQFLRIALFEYFIFPSFNFKNVQAYRKIEATV